MTFTRSMKQELVKIYGLITFIGVVLIQFLLFDTSYMKCGRTVFGNDKRSANENKL